MSLPKRLKQRKELSEWSILTAYRGSITHGMYIPNRVSYSIDDKDVICICVPPLEYYFGVKQYGSRGTKEIKDEEWDIVIYEFRKYISLLIKGNPNVLSSLWLEDTDYIWISDEGDLLIKNRDLFITRQIYHSFVGYAKGQLHKMTHQAYEGYMGEKRKKLVDKFGYDTKNASHLIRLLRMGIEVMVEGRLYVRRKDNNELIDIKRGEWSLNKVEKEADNLFRQAREAYINSKLPNDINWQRVNELCVDILNNRFGRWGITSLAEEKVLKD